MSEVRDPYAVLGVSKSARQDEIKRAYKRLARKYHPDVNPGDEAAETKFKEVSAAYELLETEDKRKLFDEFGHQAASSGFDPEKARAYRSWQEQQSATGGSPFGAGGPQDFEVDLGEMFGDLFGRGRRGGFGGGFGGFRAEDLRVPRRGADVTAEMRVGFLEAVRGAEKSFSMTVPGGPGAPQAVNTSVKIPPGVKDGQKLRLRGRGMPGRDGGQPGDLLIDIRVEPHPVLRRDGADLLLDVPVTVKEALLGGKIEVPTLEGPVKLTIPPGSQSGTKLRLKGKGGPKPAGADRGDLLITLVVKLPGRSDAPAAKDAAEALESLYDAPVRRGLEL